VKPFFSPQESGEQRQRLATMGCPERGLLSLRATFSAPVATMTVPTRVTKLVEGRRGVGLAWVVA
jgi:hypothetical protein